MACSKYTITNTGTTVVNFNYRKCEDSMWEYQVEVLPNETKNVWVVNNTYSTAFNSNIELVNEGTFPPVNATATPTPTPNVTPTPSVTAGITPTPTNTSTPTPSVTAGITPTPTNTSTPTPTPTIARTSFSSYWGATANQSCDSFSGVTIYGDKVLFDENTQFYDSLSGPVTTDMSGFYSYGGEVTEVGSNGSQIGVFTLCSVVPTVTPTPTLTNTPSPTLTNTPSPTPTFGFYTYSLGTGATSGDACTDFGSAPNTIYGTVAGGVGPNIGESLYFNTALTVPVMDGYYSNGTAWYQVTGGAGLITSSDPNGC